MFDKTSIRRALLTIVFGVLCITAGYQYAWHKDEFDFGNAGASLSWLGVVLMFLALLLWMAFDRKSDHPAKILGATVLGAVAAIWGKEVLSGINTQNLLILLGILLGFVTFVVLISVKGFSFFHKFERAERDVEYVDGPDITHDGTTVVSAV
jgi:peptidoglycan/LPS O-acetylase OafA/YrhL